MDTGKGYLEPFENKERMKFLQKVFGVDRSIFKEGEILEIKNSRFEISKIIRNGLKLKLLPDQNFTEKP